MCIVHSTLRDATTPYTKCWADRPLMSLIRHSLCTIKEVKMIPALNQILFLFSTLFGLNTPFIAEEAIMNLNLESKTATIEFLDLKTLTEAVTTAEQGLNEIDNATSFDEHFAQLNLESKSIEKKDGKLNARLTFSFENQDELFKILRFNLTHYGEHTSSDALYYHLLPSENLTSSNGTEIFQDDITILKWSNDVKEIVIELKQKENAKELMGDMKSIAEYWKK